MEAEERAFVEAEVPEKVVAWTEVFVTKWREGGNLTAV